MRRVVSLFLPTWPTDRLSSSSFGSPHNANHPKLAQITAIRDGGRRVVASANAAARAYGLRPGITISQARAMVAEIDVREADFIGDSAGLKQLGLWAMQFSPLVAVDPPDGLWLDISGAAHLHGGERALLEKLVHKFKGYGVTVRAAAATTPGAAHALARYGQGNIVSVEELTILDPLPVAALRLDRDSLDTLHRLGIDRIGALRSFARAPLTHRLGQTIAHRLDSILGYIFEPIEWLVAPSQLNVDCRLLEPVTTAGGLQSIIELLCLQLCEVAQTRNKGIRVIDLRFERVDGEPQVLRAGTSRPTRNARHLAALLGSRLATVDPGFGIEAASLTAHLTEPLLSQQLDVGLEDKTSPLDITALVDSLVNRFGRRSVYRVSARQSDMPERSILRVAPIGRLDDVWPNYPRPARLLDPPEPVVTTALLPDQPPVRFNWRGTWHRVNAADGPERVYGEWWLADTETASVRDYFTVENENGSRFWLFRAGDGADPDTGSMDWFLHGLW